MAIELEGLIERINSEGVEKAEAQKKEIIENAHREASKIISDAKSEAARILKEGKSESEKLEQRAKSAVQQASRDVLLALREEILNRLQNLIKKAIGEAMNSDLMGQIALTIAKQNTANANDLTLIIPQSMQKECVDKLIKTIQLDLQKAPELHLSNSFGAGLKIGFKGSDLFLDFTDEALKELIFAYVGPRIAELLKND